MNIYEKIQKVKKELLSSNLKKTGENKYAGFKYYELSDFLPTLINLCEENKLYTKVIFDNELAKLIIINAEKIEEVEEYTSPMRDLELKGCNQIQALGGIETYQRRYLYMCAFDIVENDMFDKVTSDEEKKEDKKQDIEIVDINAKVGFGKYENSTWLEVYDKNPKYFDWLIQNAKTKKGAEVYKKIREEIENSMLTITDEEYENILN